MTERSCVSKMEGPRPDKLWLDPDKPPANAIALPPNSKTSNRCMHYIHIKITTTKASK